MYLSWIDYGILALLLGELIIIEILSTEIIID